MLFNGDRLPPQRARGLMWLTLARDSATADETWIEESYDRAIAKASQDDRAMALQMPPRWLRVNIAVGGLAGWPLHATVDLLYPLCDVEAAKTVDPEAGDLRQEGCRRHASIKGL
jgi:hypothetical protein